MFHLYTRRCHVYGYSPVSNPVGRDVKQLVVQWFPVGVTFPEFKWSQFVGRSPSEKHLGVTASEILAVTANCDTRQLDTTG